MGTTACASRAAPAEAAEMHREVRDPEAVVPGVREREPVELPVLEIPDRAAGLADQVVVTLQSGVVARRRAGMVHPHQEAQVDQRVERAVHGPTRDAGYDPGDLGVQIVGRGVVVAAQGCGEDHAALHRERHAPGANALGGGSQRIHGARATTHAGLVG